MFYNIVKTNVRYRCAMKNFVKVIVSFDCDGTLTPKVIIWDDSQSFNIDKITDIRFTPSPKNEKAGIRYTCLIHGKQQKRVFATPVLFTVNSGIYFLKTAAGS